MQSAGLTGTATVADLSAALDLPPKQPDGERRIWSDIIERMDAPPVEMTGETCSERLAAAEAQRAREQTRIVRWSDIDRAREKVEEWRRLDALRSAARKAAELVQLAGQYADDAWLAAASEDEIRDRARATAELMRAALNRRAAAEGRAQTPDELRRGCPMAQRRRMRRRAADVRQFWAAALRLAGGKTGPRFADSYTLARWRERQERAAAFGAACRWRRDDGLELTAGEVMTAAAVANLNRLYVQILGIERIAAEAGLVPVMITLTLPGAYHPNPAIGACTWTPQTAPIAADAELQKRWARFRAHLGRAGVPPLGLRVTEAHGDGCPHCHALLFVEPDRIPAIDAALRAACPDEPGARQRVASNLIEIDTGRARASTYVLKYLIKSMNVAPALLAEAKGLTAETRRDLGAAVALDTSDIDGEDAEDAIADYDRHRALASERHWRRYALLGVHGMQRVWQRLHRLNPDSEDVAEMDTITAVRAHPALVGAWVAMRRRDWAGALLALGAVRHPAVADVDAGRACLVYEGYTNEYGESARRPAGIGWTGDDPAEVIDPATGEVFTRRPILISLRDHTWTMIRPGSDPAKSLKKNTRTVAVSYPSGPADEMDPGQQQRESVVTLLPQPPPRRNRGSILSMTEGFQAAA